MNGKSISRLILALFFAGGGVNHFVHPAPYLAMMPPSLPHPETLHLMAGTAEILGGIGVLIPQTRRLAGWGLIALLLAVFPANLQVALHGWPGVSLPQWSLWVRLPLQIALIWWVYSACLKTRAAANAKEP